MECHTSRLYDEYVQDVHRHYKCIVYKTICYSQLNTIYTFTKCNTKFSKAVCSTRFFF